MSKASDPSEAIELYHAALQSFVAAAGGSEEHPLVAKAYTGMALVFQKRGNRTQALAMYERAIAIKVATLGPGHPSLGSVCYSLALLLLEQGKGRAAVGRFGEARRMCVGAFGEHHRAVVKLDAMLAKKKPSNGGCVYTAPL
jgi:tetratricopeptide (TPR) repeat protein